MTNIPRFPRGPFPSPSFEKQVAGVSMQPNAGTVSGEVTANGTDLFLTVARYGGRILNAALSVKASGKDDAEDLYVEADVLINGVSCLTTKPRIAHVSGEASARKTTLVTGDTGIVQAVINVAAAEFAVGDILSWNMELERTASPTTEVSNPSIIVEVEPL